MEKFNEAGFLLNPDDWSYELMEEIAKREGILLNDRMVDYIISARTYFLQNSTVPPLREFSKMHGGDRKGTILNQLFNGGPMKKIAMLGGLPQPTGCV